MTTWQPIETAPRDGSWFVIAAFHPFTIPEYETGRYSPRNWTAYVSVGDGLYRAETRPIIEWTFDNFHRATHWMPLPPAPGDQSGAMA